MTGGIHLPTEKDMQVAAGFLSRLRQWITEQVSNLWRGATGRQAIHLGSNSSTATLQPPSGLQDDSPAVSPSILESERNPFADRRSTKQYGSAYGYGRRPSVAGSTLAGTLAGESGLRIPSMRRRTGRSVSVATSNRYDPENEMVHSFAERYVESSYIDTLQKLTHTRIGCYSPTIKPFST